jgi:hypothetical protein
MENLALANFGGAKFGQLNTAESVTVLPKTLQVQLNTALLILYDHLLRACLVGKFFWVLLL